MNKDWPDVIVLDLEIPRMDGLTFLRKLMGRAPDPGGDLLVLGRAQRRGLPTLAVGAVTVVTKPKADIERLPGDAADDVISAVRAAAKASCMTPHREKARVSRPGGRPRSHPGAASRTRPFEPPSDIRTPRNASWPSAPPQGTTALEFVLRQLDRAVPGIAIVQHMPEVHRHFRAAPEPSLRHRGARARHGDRLHPGLALIAPGRQHMQVRRNGAFTWSTSSPARP